MDSAAAARLLGRLRHVAGDDTLDLAEPPSPLAGGFETATFAFRLRATSPAWAMPLVLRVLPPHAPDAWLEREAAVHRRLAALGYPVARLLDACADRAIVGGPFLVMERLAGRDLLADAMPRRLAHVTPTLALTQIALHALPPGELASVLGGSDEPLAEMAARIERARLDGLRAGLAWLGAHRPSAREEVVCHGDFHPRNVLARDGAVTGVIDWSLVMMAAPEFDVGSTKIVLAYAPTDLPRGLRALVGLFQRWVVAPRYERQYRARRRIDPGAVRFYEALRAFRCLVWAGEARRLAEGMALDRVKPGPWHEPRIARRLARHFRRATGVAIALPGTPRV